MCSPVKFKFHLNVKCLCLGFLFTIHRVSALIFTLWSTPLGTPLPRLLTANVCSASWQWLVQAQIRGSCNSYHEGLNWWPSSCQSQVWRYPSAEQEQVSPSVFSSSAGVLVSSFKKNFCPTEESSVVFLARWKTKNQYLALEAVSCVIGRAALTVCTASQWGAPLKQPVTSSVVLELNLDLLPWAVHTDVKSSLKCSNKTTNPWI